MDRDDAIGHIELVRRSIVELMVTAMDAASDAPTVTKAGNRAQVAKDATLALSELQMLEDGLRESDNA